MSEASAYEYFKLVCAYSDLLDQHRGRRRCVSFAELGRYACRVSGEKLNDIEIERLIRNSEPHREIYFQALTSYSNSFSPHARAASGEIVASRKIGDHHILVEMENGITYLTVSFCDQNNAFWEIEARGPGGVGGKMVIGQADEGSIVLRVTPDQAFLLSLIDIIMHPLSKLWLFMRAP